MSAARASGRFVRGWAIGLVAALLCVACAGSLPPPVVLPAPLPPVDRAASLERRQQVFEAYRLAAVPGPGTQWRRADGRFELLRLDAALDAYPESRAAAARLLRSARQRLTVAMALLVVGSATVAAALFNTVGPSDNRWPTGARVGLGAGGAALMVSPFLVQWLWRLPTAEVAQRYNEALRRDLGL